MRDHYPQGITKRRKKPCRMVTKCEHTDEKHYAKVIFLFPNVSIQGMCYLCYHKKGRTKLAYKCPHSTEVHYSRGLCQPCYIT